MSRRYPVPEYLEDATRFSDDDDFDQVAFLRALKAQGWLCDPLVAATVFDVQWGRPRKGGSWLLAFAAHVASGDIHIESWYRNAPDEVWIEAGFPCRNRAGRRPHRPDKSSVYTRFAELEQRTDEVWQAVAALVANARRTMPQIGRYWVIDSTASAAHVRFHHDCDDEASCPDAQAAQEHAAKGKRGRRRKTRLPRPRNLTAHDAMTAARWKVVADDGSEHEIPRDFAEVAMTGVVWEVDGDRIEVQRVENPERGEPYMRLRVIDENGQVGCWYRTRCAQAWVRAYRDPRTGKVTEVWVGYYHQAIVDAVTGGSMFVNVFTNRRNEYIPYPQTYGAGEQLFGPPLAVITDAGFDQYATFEHNRRRGVASITPLRNHAHAPVATDFATHNRYGELLCRFCGSPAAQTRFATGGNGNGGPRVWARCIARTTASCRSKETSLACSTDWRRLLPLSRTTERFHELFEFRNHREHAHKDRRSRYKVAGKHLFDRHKRIGTDVQKLRAAMGCLIEWFRINEQYGMLNARAAADRQAEAFRRSLKFKRHLDKAREKLARQLERRRAAGVALPYGPAARALNPEAPLDPPSARARAGPDPPTG